MAPSYLVRQLRPLRGAARVPFFGSLLRRGGSRGRRRRPAPPCAKGRLLLLRELLLLLLLLLLPPELVGADLRLPLEGEFPHCTRSLGDRLPPRPPEKDVLAACWHILRPRSRFPGKQSHAVAWPLAAEDEFGLERDRCPMPPRLTSLCSLQAAATGAEGDAASSISHISHLRVSSRGQELRRKAALHFPVRWHGLMTLLEGNG